MKTIDELLAKITPQGRWLLAKYEDPNTRAVDDCLDRLSTALEKFKVCLRIDDVHNFGG